MRDLFLKEPWMSSQSAGMKISRARLSSYRSSPGSIWMTHCPHRSRAHLQQPAQALKALSA